MNPHRKPRRHGADDLDHSHYNPQRHHKTAQLCRQVQRALSLALAACADDLLRETQVIDVRPAPDAARLAVFILAPAAAPVDLLARLEAARGLLRAQVAQSITRKRAPELLFIPTLDRPQSAPREEKP